MIGSVGEQSGIAGASVAPGATGVQAWASAVNAGGGLACHPIKFIKVDDGGDPATNLSETKQIVSQDHAVAFVYNDSALAWQGSAQYLQQNNIPVVGNDGGETIDYQDSNIFPQIGAGHALVYELFAGVISQLTPAQKAHFGLLSCIEAASCALVAGDAPGLQAKLGFKMVYNGTGSITALNYDSQCQAAKQAGVQAFFAVLDPNSLERWGSSCHQVGYTGLIATGSDTLVPGLASDPDLNGLLFGSPVVPWTDSANPQIAAMDSALAKYAPGASPVGSTAVGWAAAQLFADSAKYWPNSDTITSADIEKALGHIKNDDLGGLTGPLTFTTGQPTTPVVCWWPMVLKNGAWLSTNNNQRACAQ